MAVMLVMTRHYHLYHLNKHHLDMPIAGAIHHNINNRIFQLLHIEFIKIKVIEITTTQAAT
jgi:hypothetical protein